MVELREKLVRPVLDPLNGFYPPLPALSGICAALPCSWNLAGSFKSAGDCVKEGIG
jgi:hypothetical protein